MKKSKSALFLMELIIVIFFFSLTSAICLQVFVKAHTVANNSDDLNKASLWATNVGECFYDFQGNEGLICDALKIDDSNNTDGIASFSVDDEYNISLSFSEDINYKYMKYDFVSFSDNFTYTFTYKIQKKEVVLR